MKLEVKHGERNEKKLITWRLKNMLIKNQCVNSEIQEEILKNTLRQMTMKTQPYKIYGMQQK